MANPQRTDGLLPLPRSEDGFAVAPELKKRHYGYRGPPAPEERQPDRRHPGWT